jgi:hypothetical protein
MYNNGDYCWLYLCIIRVHALTVGFPINYDDYELHLLQYIGKDNVKTMLYCVTFKVCNSYQF